MYNHTVYVYNKLVESVVTLQTRHEYIRDYGSRCVTYTAPH